MTYEEAEVYKSKIEPTFIHNGIHMTTYITPAADDDFEEYKTAWRSIKISDGSAKMFCRNNDYMVRGINFMRDINAFWFFNFPL